METIIPIGGRVKYKITLDPGVWIFDDRKVDLNTYFNEDQKTDDALEEYTKSVSKHWDREIMEGAVYPPTLKTEVKFEKEKVLTGTFGIPFKPFLDNAEPDQTAGTVVIEYGDNDQIALSLKEASGIILGFSKDGKPLKEDGPLHVYFKDGSNKDSPIKNVTGFLVE
ncbi:MULTISPECIES: peptidyl-prolyl cis-trans isomerase [unclassified Bacillus (in: firmicutes)]|uniref:peptidyl-prolyl cis-trans isomerase n=1 Tax=unclassified Bacillus (in: firmicutes) TaxID=185979 RepID=UPI001BE7D675|nr:MULTISPECIES: peptidyl-prolyl cis-trans isomerase [unclassified Bacillus (in: firmicutes)]MBT2637283.1 peptidyl-prolyl cis-trans isomerase [Bacillus sp. ISL-39]MBT2660356.1 peptidyl-prolyl cis-trans isomerase [Bacillus sp. ISL-45]